MFNCVDEKFNSPYMHLTHCSITSTKCQFYPKTRLLHRGTEPNFRIYSGYASLLHSIVLRTSHCDLHKCWQGLQIYKVVTTCLLTHLDVIVAVEKMFFFWGGGIRQASNCDDTAETKNPFLVSMKSPRATRCHERWFKQLNFKLLVLVDINQLCEDRHFRSVGWIWKVIGLIFKGKPVTKRKFIIWLSTVVWCSKFPAIVLKFWSRLLMFVCMQFLSKNVQFEASVDPWRS
jgi:hypothetical protein